MKWAYSIQQKFKAAVLLAVIGAVVLASNLIERQHIDEISTSFSSVYKDRLVVESYIYELSDHLYQKKMMLDHCPDPAGPDLRSEIGTHNAAINSLLDFYAKTRLTKEEAVCFDDLKSNVATLQDLEWQYLQYANDEDRLTATRTQLNEHFGLASANLRRLSRIQVSEGKMLNDQSQRIAKGSFLLSSLEMVVLICIGCIIQAIVLASRPAISRVRQRGSLN